MNNEWLIQPLINESINRVLNQSVRQFIKETLVLVCLLINCQTIRNSIHETSIICQQIKPT